ncbi:nicotinate-nucleotide--dimethylbenzimidazole phosphoribosyltransferase [Amphibiibacter pelophylacis]|uniref:Nicotinate-nucleotide--dimethylbenzimidazole phosphoribosyltransferase n=1 Tax=Amphibiibacter pelophylacis TaxID=1799477 RepID=A0ACC6P4C9_9BURK
MTESTLHFPTDLLDLPAVRDAARQAALQHHIDHLTKPVGSLGRLEDLMRQLGLLQRLQPGQRLSAQGAGVWVFAADHGLARAGVSAYPSEVTAQMVANFLAGGAAIAVLARESGLPLQVVNAGVATPLADQPGLINVPVAPGCASSLDGPAMTPQQTLLALQRGAQAVRGAPGDVVLLGEMGIGNTSAATLLTARLTGQPLRVGRGTGLDDAGLARKQAVLEQVLARHPELPPADHLEAAFPPGLPQDEAARRAWWALQTLGGLEVAMLVGAIVQAARQGQAVLVDGLIVTSALLVAAALAPGVLDHAVLAHRSHESAHADAIAHLDAQHRATGGAGLTPLLDLGLRLGEGSGAALAWPLLRQAVALFNDMASFDSARVSTAHAAS